MNAALIAVELEALALRQSQLDLQQAYVQNLRNQLAELKKLAGK